MQDTDAALSQPVWLVVATAPAPSVPAPPAPSALHLVALPEFLRATRTDSTWSSPVGGSWSPCGDSAAQWRDAATGLCAAREVTGLWSASGPRLTALRAEHRAPSDCLAADYQASDCAIGDAQCLRSFRADRDADVAEGRRADSAELARCRATYAAGFEQPLGEHVVFAAVDVGAMAVITLARTRLDDAAALLPVMRSSLDNEFDILGAVHAMEAAPNAQVGGERGGRGKWRAGSVGINAMWPRGAGCLWGRGASGTAGRRCVVGGGIACWVRASLIDTTRSLIRAVERGLRFTTPRPLQPPARRTALGAQLRD